LFVGTFDLLGLLQQPPDLEQSLFPIPPTPPPSLSLSLPREGVRKKERKRESAKEREREGGWEGGRVREDGAEEEKDGLRRST